MAHMQDRYNTPRRGRGAASQPRLRPRHAGRAPVVVAALAAAGALAGCGAPTAGLWQGTADIGPIDAFPLVVQLPAEGLAGEVELRIGEGVQRHAICAGQARGGVIELEIDWTHRDCTVPDGAAADRRRLRGRLGPSLIAGAIYRGEEQVGFFRAYREAPR
jgi:hypothetical protein